MVADTINDFLDPFGWIAPGLQVFLGDLRTDQCMFFASRFPGIMEERRDGQDLCIDIFFLKEAVGQRVHPQAVVKSISERRSLHLGGSGVRIVKSLFDVLNHGSVNRHIYSCENIEQVTATCKVTVTSHLLNYQIGFK